MTQSSATIRSWSPRLTDDWITKNSPPYIDSLPRRDGLRAQFERAFPCRQVTQVAHPDAQQVVLALTGGWPGVTVGPPRQTIPDCRALRLDENLAQGQGEAFIMGREFAHVRSEGSVHLTLPPEWAVQVMEKSWGQLHPLALYGLIPPQNTLLYAPRDDHEVDALASILVGSYSFCCGRQVVCQR